jgi:hypothetical protein
MWQYDPVAGSYVNYYQAAYTYDPMNNKTTQTEQFWNSSTAAWANSRKYTYTYNSASNLTTQTRLGWFSGAWLNQSFDTFVYNSSNNVILDIESGWSSSTLSWVVDAKDTFMYDAANNLARYVHLGWDGSTWTVAYSRAYSNYAAPGLYQLELFQGWNGSGYVNSLKDSITYNSYGQPVFDFETEWSSSTNSWNLDTVYIMHYYYELYTNGVMQVNNDAATFDVYPNPASGLINISVDVAGGKNTMITLQDVAGRVVRTIDGADLKTGLNTIQCTTDELPAGAYFVHVANDKANVTRKVVITK